MSLKFFLIKHTFGHLTQQQSSQLVELLGFAPTDTWTLIYQGKQHGFSSASHFHSRCDNKHKTLTIVESTNGNIFGGYTDLAWSTGSVYKSDPNAFIFSLVNSHGRAVKFPIKSNEVNQACYWTSSLSSVFGNWDMRIESNANANTNSIADLGVTYNTSGVVVAGTPEAQSFLAGSLNFQINDIAVYQRSWTDDYFMSARMLDDLSSLLEIPKQDEWTIIYRGTQHGFHANNFHSRCDGRLKTLVVVQSASKHIFGGYTDLGWGTGSTFKYDPNAVIFSLRNPSNQQPRRFKLKSNTRESIYWSGSYGPIFGNYDIWIGSNSHWEASTNSEDIGVAYNTSGLELFNTAGYLTGARSFIVNELVVYQRTQTSSYFMSAEMYAQLVELTGLPSIDRWSLLYRGSSHGFVASAFHSRCDGKANTVTLVESVNSDVFGGYTEAVWGTGSVFRPDPNAFIFSLKNKLNRPAKFPIKSGAQSQAIYASGSYGPSFGNFDFRIDTFANVNANCLSNLGMTYNTTGFFAQTDASGPESFLAGSTNFQINDVVVFQII